MDSLIQETLYIFIQRLILKTAMSCLSLHDVVVSLFWWYLTIADSQSDCVSKQRQFSSILTIHWFLWMPFIIPYNLWNLLQLKKYYFSIKWSCLLWCNYIFKALCRLTRRQRERFLISCTSSYVIFINYNFSYPVHGNETTAQKVHAEWKSEKWCSKCSDFGAFYI